jgi:hypothetical protein
MVLSDMLFSPLGNVRRVCNYSVFIDENLLDVHIQFP